MKLTLEIIMYLFSAIGGIVSIWQIIIWLNPRRKISWREVKKGILQLRDDLVNENYHPTLIIGIGWGGSIIGTLLSETFGNIPIIVSVHEWKNSCRNDSFFEGIHLTKSLERVLIVAGELHTGGTMKNYYEYFVALGAGQVKTLAFMKDSHPFFKPDFFYLKSTNGDDRLPWLITDNYKRESHNDYSTAYNL